MCTTGMFTSVIEKINAALCERKKLGKRCTGGGIMKTALALPL
jgi:hypothetical protein